MWDQVETPPAAPPKKSRGWRKGAKGAAAAGVGGATAAAILAEPPGADTAVTGSPTAASKPEADPFGGFTPPAEPGGSVAAPPAEPKRKTNRTLLWVLLAVVIVAVGVGTYFVVKKNNTTTATTPPTAVTSPSPSPAVADAALAASINLHLTDLPAGWTQTVGPGQVPTTSLAPASAQARANQALAGCLGEPVAVVSGLFGGGVIPGQTASIRSPSFQSGADPNIQMFSETKVFQTTAEAQSLAAPFARANFATCFGQYQSSLVAAAVPGATAQVETVQLQSPAGIRGFGYLTTLTVPNQGTQVVGEAFIVGGRMETVIEPTTNGPPVPQAPFGAAYNSVTARMALAVDK